MIEDQDTTRSDAIINEHKVIHARIPEVVDPLKYVSIGHPRRHAVGGPRDYHILPGVFERYTKGLLQFLRAEAHHVQRRLRPLSHFGKVF